MAPTILDLPEEVLRMIHKEAKRPGARICDLWFRLTVYEHRIRNKVVSQMVLSGLCMDDLQGERFLQVFFICI